MIFTQTWADTILSLRIPPSNQTWQWKIPYDPQFIDDFPIETSIELPALSSQPR